MSKNLWHTTPFNLRVKLFLKGFIQYGNLMNFSFVKKSCLRMIRLQELKITNTPIQTIRGHDYLINCEKGASMLCHTKPCFTMPYHIIPCHIIHVFIKSGMLNKSTTCKIKLNLFSYYLYQRLTKTAC